MYQNKGVIFSTLLQLEFEARAIEVFESKWFIREVTIAILEIVALFATAIIMYKC